MLTRRRVRRWGTWAGLVLGVLGLLVLAVSAFGVLELRTHGRTRSVSIGSGAISYHWTRTTYRVVNGKTVPLAAGVEFRPASGAAWRILPSVDETNGWISFPAWTLILVGLWSAYRLLPEGVMAGRCGKCGFDLKGVPAREGRLTCPECGAVSRAERVEGAA